MYAAQRGAPGLTASAQFFEALNAADAACSPRFHALADPDFFLRQQFIGLGLDDGFLLQLLGLECLILRKITRVRAQQPPVQFHNARGNPIQKGPVVRDGDHAALEIQEQVLQPSDGVHIQMVGGLIQQQYIGLGDQGLRQSHTLFGAAGEVTNTGAGIQMQALQCFLYALLPVPSIHGFNLRLQCIQIDARRMRQILLTQCSHFCHAQRRSLKHGVFGVEVRFLCHVGNADARLQLQLPIIGMGQPSQYL